MPAGQKNLVKVSEASAVLVDVAARMQAKASKREKMPRDDAPPPLHHAAFRRSLQQRHLANQLFLRQFRHSCSSNRTDKHAESHAGRRRRDTLCQTINGTPRQAVLSSTQHGGSSEADRESNLSCKSAERGKFDATAWLSASRCRRA